VLRASAPTHKRRQILGDDLDAAGILSPDVRMRVHRSALLITGLIGCLPAPPLRAAPSAAIVQVELHGVINPVKVRYLARAIDDAHRRGAGALLVSIDTPGGLVSSMQEIVELITNARLPVIGLVEPSTAQATSAGALVLLATDVAAMLPDTRVGSAHPVGAGQPLRGAVAKKATNSLSALARSLAGRSGRSPEAAEAMVRASVSYTAAEALEKKIIELVPTSRAELLRTLEGRTLRHGTRSFTLRTNGVSLHTPRLSWSERVLDTVADPTLASVLLTIGVLGILYELSAPGIGLGGIAGVVALVIALLSMSVLPVRMAGIALFVAGLAAIALEVKTPAHGLLGLGGLAAIAVGAVVLIDEARYFGATPELRWGVFAPTLLLGTLGVLGLATVVRKAQRSPLRMGVEALPGARGHVRAAIIAAPDGFAGSVWVAGARWPALADSAIGAGEPIEVVAVVHHPTRLRVRRSTGEQGES
jgi:membrane-bound serine protease (ClpP class)